MRISDLIKLNELQRKQYQIVNKIIEREMRKLTHYEIIVLIKAQIELMFKESIVDKCINLTYIEGRAQEIINYIEEYNSLDDNQKVCV